MWFQRKKADLKELVAGVSNLVSLPQAYFRINEMINDTHSSATKIGEVISHDPALTARLLRFVNSPAYGLRCRVDSVPRAITVLGVQELRVLALASSVGGAFRKPPADLVDMTAYWHHSVYTGILAKYLGKYSRLKSVERLFVAGLLHDVGQLVLAHQAPELLRKVIGHMQQYPHHRCQLEQKIIGYDHAEVGAELMRQWQLPDSLWIPVCYHHAPEQAREYQVETALVHMANAIADGVEPSRRSTAVPQQSPIDPVAWELTGLIPDVIAPACKDASVELFDTLDIIAPSGSLLI